MAIIEEQRIIGELRRELDDEEIEYQLKETFLELLNYALFAHLSEKVETEFKIEKKEESYKLLGKDFYTLISKEPRYGDASAKFYTCVGDIERLNIKVSNFGQNPEFEYGDQSAVKPIEASIAMMTADGGITSVAATFIPLSYPLTANGYLVSRFSHQSVRKFVSEDEKRSPYDILEFSDLAEKTYRRKVKEEFNPEATLEDLFNPNNILHTKGRTARIKAKQSFNAQQG